jgi:4-amino-4-deoxy-L-arabinose transferase-like glycosyltransferase
MRISFPKILISRLPAKNITQASQEEVLRWLSLGAILLLGGVLRFGNLGDLGYANHYYTAAISSMLKSWHNFFYLAAEPGGSVSVDKTPVGLWLQAISAYFLGVNSLGVLLPQIIAGLLSILLLYHLVQRKFGVIAGLLAALILAITPVVVATDRNNTIDSTFADNQTVGPTSPAGRGTI